MRRSRIVSFAIFSILMMVISSGLVSSGPELSQSRSCSVPASISADANVTYRNISGIVIDDRGYLVVSEFMVTVTNTATDQETSTTFSGGNFTIKIFIPTFAQENQTLLINITSTDGRTDYGGTQLVLTNISSTSTYEVEIFIANPPPSYSWFFIIIFVIAFGGILAAYAIFTKWMVGKMILRKAEQIRLDEWKKKGGGQAKP